MRVALIRAMLLGIALTATPATAPAAEVPVKEQVDLLLCLAADVSHSVNHERFQLQRDGYVAALTDPRVLRAIQSGPLRRIGVTYVEWSGQLQQKIVVDWTIIDGFDAAEHFVEQLAESPRPFSDNTAIGTAIEFCLQQFYESPYDSERKTIDISGDGANNDGRDAGSARDSAIREGVVINGLPILNPLSTFLSERPNHSNPLGGLEAYYRNNVIGGFGAFVMVAESHASFGTAIVKKMIAEIAMR